LRFQPDSPLSQWYHRRFGGGTARMRRTGIVALARKLLIALWRYLEHGDALEQAAEMDWEAKLRPPSRRQRSQGRDQSPQVPPPDPHLLPSSLCSLGGRR
jgi:hypothetical protein